MRNVKLLAHTIKLLFDCLPSVTSYNHLLDYILHNMHNGD